MCGIVGVVYGPDGSVAERITPATAAKSMFTNVEHRGKDAFGWMHNTGSGKIQLRKWAQPATKGLHKLEAAHRHGIPDKTDWWIGHVRLATHGTPNYTHNNHPIVHGNIMGVHNGMVYNYTKVLRDTGRQYPKADVDSEALFAAIDKYGIVDGLDKIDSLAALVFVDKRDPTTIYLATCDANPLIVARSKQGATYFASESWILDKLELEWEEEPWKMADYTILTIKDGVEVEYAHWADPKEKDKSGYGRWSYGDYNSSYGGYSGGEGTANNVERASEDAIDFGDGWYFDEKSQAFFPAREQSTSSGNGSGISDDSRVGLSDDPLLECAVCGWSGMESALDPIVGDCPNCHRYEYLIPKEMSEEDKQLARWEAEEMEAGRAFADRVRDEAEARPSDHRQEYIDWWNLNLQGLPENERTVAELTNELRNMPITINENGHTFVVEASGKVVRKSEYDAQQTALKVLTREVH